MTKLYLTLTGSAKSFEEELAHSFGPEGAHRLVADDGLCVGTNSFSHRPDRTP